MNEFARLFKYYRPYLLIVLIATMFSISVSFVEAGIAILVKPLIDEIFFGHNQKFLKIIPLILFAMVGLKGIFAYFHTYLMSRAGAQVVVNIRSDLFRHYMRFGQSQFDHTPTGHLMSRISADVNSLNALVPALIQIVRQSFTLVTLMIVALFRDWQLTIVGMSVVPMTGIPIWIIGKKLKKFRRKSLRSLGSLNSIAFEAFGGIQVIKAFSAEDIELDKFKKENRHFFKIMIRSMLTGMWVIPLTEIITIVGVSAVFVIGGLHALRGDITPGEFFSFVAAVVLMYRPIRRLSDIMKSLQNMLGSGERIFEILDEPPTISEKPNAVKLDPIKEKIEFKNVWFRYPMPSMNLMGKDFELDEEPDKQDTLRDWVLKDVSFVVNKGETVALVGPSGAGKSSIASLMPRFYDVEKGEITIDGVDIRNATFVSLRDQMAMVTQETFLFNEPVRDNIGYGLNRIVSREDTIAAAEAADANDFISAMPEGYDTVIGERGVRLSGGQRQRLAIARALLRNAPILILDEATSNLDSEAEVEVQKALERLMKDRTTIVIAHRLSTIRDATRIVVLDEGRKVEEGTHAELLEKNGVYKRLYELQYYGDEGAKTAVG